LNLATKAERHWIPLLLFGIDNGVEMPVAVLPVTTTEPLESTASP
jgi:hypothetical protein